MKATSHRMRTKSPNPSPGFPIAHPGGSPLLPGHITSIYALLPVTRTIVPPRPSSHSHYPGLARARPMTCSVLSFSPIASGQHSRFARVSLNAGFGQTAATGKAAALHRAPVTACSPTAQPSVPAAALHNQTPEVITPACCSTLHTTSHIHVHNIGSCVSRKLRAGMTIASTCIPRYGIELGDCVVQQYCSWQPRSVH